MSSVNHTNKYYGKRIKIRKFVKVSDVLCFITYIDKTLEVIYILPDMFTLVNSQF